jgi:hypothetical protein
MNIATSSGNGEERMRMEGRLLLRKDGSPLPRRIGANIYSLKID